MNKTNLLFALGAGLGIITSVIAVNVIGGEKKIGQTIARRDPSGDPSGDPMFRKAVGVPLGPALTDGDRIESLVNGDQIFPAMLSAIRNAQQTITFESYIYGFGLIGREFCHKGREGLKSLSNL